jgi:hypothetical protein
MRLHTATGWRSILFSTLLLCTSAWAKKDKPSIKSKQFDFLPRNVNYFEDSDVLLFEDDVHSDVYRSTDAGATWDKLEEGKGKMLEILMHPFDKMRAYILTVEKTHYKTTDQGKTWEKFEVDAQATLFGPALSFHAADPDRVIFNAMDCTGIFCSELVRLADSTCGIPRIPLTGLLRRCTPWMALPTPPKSYEVIPLAAYGQSLPSFSRQDRRIWTTTGWSAW